MATYWITEVAQPTGEPISHVCVRSATDGRASDTPFRLSRSTIVTDLSNPNGDRYWTATRGYDKAWRKGAEVKLTPDGKFITTEGNNVVRDNLGSLPDCTC